MIKKILLGLVALITLVLIYAATRPNTFSVQRTIMINAPAAKVYPYLADFHRWQAWSPWEHLDPAMQRTHSGAPSGQGAIYAWLGNDKVGQGRMEITGAQPPADGTTAKGRLLVKLDFIKPFESANTTEFTLNGSSDGTEVVWTMRGPSPYITKLMTVFVSMDKMVGKDFESGLARLKAAAEK
ncbi:MAG: hypothetical protein RLZZ584_1283 [Pseudomonadota bacterium]|jgi:hypothetical protein